jgi:3-oxoacyl-[acyl-carrier protein] reductase
VTRETAPEPTTSAGMHRLHERGIEKSLHERSVHERGIEGSMKVACELDGKVAIVTGGGKGIGAAVADLLAADGANVAIVGRDLAALEKHAAHIDGRHADRFTLPCRCDVTSEDQVAGMIATVLGRFGRIDILVNAAGGTGPIETPAEHYPASEFLGILALNVVGTFLPCKHAIPHLKVAGGGSIVNISGTSGLRGYRNRSGYSASKWAVRGLTRTLALELGPYNITVNDVCPNVTNGERMERIVRRKAEIAGRSPEEVYEELASQTALGRFVDEQDVALAVRFLVSAGARNITGHDIPVDAGWDV